MLIAVELALLALASWPAWRLLSIPPIRREYGRIAWALVGLLAAYAVFLAVVATLAPVLLHLLAGIALIVLIAERWRARPSYGVARGLPPGSLSLFPRGPWVDDRFFLDQAARFGPVFKFSLQHRPCVGVLGARRGAELLRAHPGELEAPRVRFNRFVPKGFLRYMEPEDHPDYKRPFRSAFSPDVLGRNEGVHREIIGAGLARLVRDSERSSERGVTPRPILREMIFGLLVVSFFGVRPEDDDFGWLRGWYEDLDLRKVSLGGEGPDRKALAQLEAWASARGRELTGASASGGAPPACFLRALVESLPGALDDETALGNLVYSLTIGRADLTALTLWVLEMLGRAPEWSGRLQAAARSGHAAEARAIALAIVRETLRLEQSEYIYRRVKQDITFEGFRIPRDWRVRVLIREGHRDPTHFPDPDRFDPNRWLGSKAPSAHFHPFGLGAHACIGAPVTEGLMCLFLTELASRCDWSVLEDGPREYGWAHWQPSSKLRLRFTLRAGEV